MAFLMNYNGGIWDDIAGGYVKGNKIISTIPMFDDYKPRMTPKPNPEDYKPRMTPPKIEVKPSKVATRGGVKYEFYETNDGYKIKTDNGKDDKAKPLEMPPLIPNNLFPSIDFSVIEKYLSVFIGIIGLGLVIKIFK